MKLKFSLQLLFLIFLGMNTSAQTQDSLPYREMPDYPKNYTAGSMASRMVDGLAFRFYWATEGLRQEDLDFRPNEASRSTDETIDHMLSMIHGMTKTLSKYDKPELAEFTFEEKREHILIDLKTISYILLNSTDEDFKSYNIKLGSGEELPFWNYVNGQIADCIWHCGQISSFRRMSGNPFSDKVDLFRGKIIE
jgi:hypothetical protein